MRLTCKKCGNKILPSEYKMITFSQPGNDFFVFEVDVCNSCFNEVLDSILDTTLSEYGLNID